MTAGVWKDETETGAVEGRSWYMYLTEKGRLAEWKVGKARYSGEYQQKLDAKHTRNYT